MSEHRPPLFERLGGQAGIRRIVEEVWQLHLANPDVSPRYAHSDGPTVVRQVTDFVCAGTGGPQRYQGRSMRDAHAGRNISHREFMAVTDDVLEALERSGVGAEEQAEVLALLFSLRGEVIHR